MMNVNELTLGQIKELMSFTNQSKTDCPFEIGKNYLIRTATFTISGKIESKDSVFLVLSSASWIADTGRFNECLKDQNKFSEVEPFLNNCIVSKLSIVDATEIKELITTVR